VKTIVWFEPERVTPGTKLFLEHPEWLLSKDSGQRLLDLGNPEARAWLADHVSNLIRQEGIDLYRNDFNMDPLPYWRAADPPDRQGITEIRYVTGFLAYWDELRKRFPNMLIDTCASGGRRIDIETLRRSVPLLRSDWLFEPESQQQHTYGLASWVPYYGTGTREIDPYIFRSNMCPAINTCWDMRRRDLNYDLARRLVGQWRSVATYYSGDYYPLTGYHIGSDVWMAWQFDRPDLGEGMVQVFRRAGSAYETARFQLRGLVPEASYEVRDLDAAAPLKFTGRELAEAGLPVSIKDRPGALTITYKRL
jgi:alpha-galactosidase